MSYGTTSDSDPFHVVFVCTGNRARSPLAEAFFRAKTSGEVVRVESFGTLAIGPEPALPEAVAVATTFGLDLRAHRARSLEAARLDDVDLVVGFEGFHVAAAVVDGGARKDRSFLLGELAQLLGQLPRIEGGPGPQHARQVIAHAHELRAGERSSTLTLADPFGGSRRVFEEAAATIDALTSAVARRLLGVSRPAHTPGPDAA